MSDSDLPRPIEFDDIRVGDTVKKSRALPWGLDELTVTVQVKSVDWVGPPAPGHALFNDAEVTWTLLARPEPEPLVPDEPTLGVLTFRDKSSATGYFRQGGNDEPIVMVRAAGEQYGSGLYQYRPGLVESFTPITVQPEGTVAVPKEQWDAVAAFITEPEVGRLRFAGSDSLALGRAVMDAVEAVRKSNGGEQQ